MQKKYEECEQCQQIKASQATPHNQVSGEDIFANFMPGQRLQVYYAEKGNGNYLMIVDCISGFMQAYKTTKKSTEDAIKCLRDWASKWGMPYEVKSDNGSSFRKEWEEELKKLGVRVIHSSAYNSQSMGLVERSVRTLKEILHKNNNLSQLLLNEQIFTVNCKDRMARFYGRGVRSGLPNSWERFVDWQNDIKR